MVMEKNIEEAYKNLANAIVMQAVDDVMQSQNSMFHREAYIWLLTASDEVEYLTGIKGTKILERLGKPLKGLGLGMY